MNYTVRTEDGTFLMTAPLMVISAAFGLFPEAAKRIERETEECLEVCELCFNRQPRGAAAALNLNKIRVSRS